MGMRSAVRSGFDFIKEWGGIGTLLIALLYNFPLEVYDRFTKSSESLTEKINGEVTKSRQDLAILADMTLRRYQEAASTADPQAKQVIYSLYGLKITQKLEENRGLFSRISDKLTSLELRMIGETYILNFQYAEGIQFLEKALEAAIKEKTTASRINLVNTELAIANSKTIFYGAEKLNEIREHLRNGLAQAWIVSPKSNNLLYYNMMGEAALSEIRLGDWDCGKKLANFALSRLSANFTGNIEAINYSNLLQYNSNAIPRRTNNVSSDCKYALYN